VAAIQIKPITKTSWKDLEALFEARGGPKYCWCMAWRDMEKRTTASAEDRKSALHQRVKEGTPIGLVAHIDGEPAGWVSVAPRDTLLKMSPDQDDEETGVWSIVCFFLRRDLRGQGLSEKMLEAAVAYAFRRGAKVVEGYPVTASSPSYRFMGFLPLFKGQGFKAAGKAGSRRHIMRKQKTRSASKAKRAP
jgi:GNAT superfamily N-acetyltransferase